ncbi:DUF6602 domain-containing protein [Nonomuraea sp. NPDC002799]
MDDHAEGTEISEMWSVDAGWPFSPRPDIINEFWAIQSKSLRNRFEEARISHRDTAVRGVANENILGSFLEAVMPSGRIATRSTVIDAAGKQSLEVDLAICNSDQPFKSSQGSAEMLIVEGVDVVIQVKARLTTAEIVSIRSNCFSVKACHKVRAADDDYREEFAEDSGRYLDHVPYFVFCFESDLSLVTACSKFEEVMHVVHPEYQPDGIFVLDKFTILNQRDGSGRIVLGPDQKGFVPMKSPDRVLADFMHCLCVFPPRIIRKWHPLAAYRRLPMP